jgi:UDP-glucose 4-epimerase
METPYEFIQADVKDEAKIKEVTKGVDAIVHGAALHGIHLSKYTTDEFWNLNVTGTHNIYQASVENDIKKVVFCSTMGVYGERYLTKKANILL